MPANMHGDQIDKTIKTASDAQGAAPPPPGGPVTRLSHWLPFSVCGS